MRGENAAFNVKVKRQSDKKVAVSHSHPITVAPLLMFQRFLFFERANNFLWFSTAANGLLFPIV